MADLVQRFGLGGSGAAFGDHERTDRFDVAVTRLGPPDRSTRLRGAGGFDGVQRVGLALPAAQLAVRSIDLDHVDARSRQEPSETGAVGARALDPDPHERPERSQPGRQLVLTGPGRLERFGAQQASDRVEHGRDVHIQVRVDATGHRPRRFCDDGHRHPFPSIGQRGGAHSLQRCNVHDPACWNRTSGHTINTSERQENSGLRPTSEAGLRDYTMRVRTTCLCSMDSPWDIVVRDGVMASATPVDRGSQLDVVEGSAPSTSCSVSLTARSA